MGIKNKFIKCKLYCFCLFTLISTILFSQITSYFVKAGGAGDGSSWDSPLGNLPHSVFSGSNGAKELNNVHIYIAEGDYTIPTGYTYSYIGGDVFIQGGFPSYATGTDLSSYNPETYVSRIVKSSTSRFANLTATINDFANNKFTIKGVYFQSSGATATTGSIVNHEAGTRYYQFKVEDCHVHDSRGSSAMFRIASGNAGQVSHWYHNNKFYRNTMGATGPFEFTTVNGDVKVLISNNLMGESTSTDGTGVYLTTAGSSSTSQARFYIIGNIFSCGIGNSTTGGVYVTNSGNTVIRNNIFLGVSARVWGGAIQTYNQIYGLHVEDNYFIQNRTRDAGGEGGAISIRGGLNSGSIISTNYINNNFFFENNSLEGGAIFMNATSTSNDLLKFDIVGNVFAYNQSSAANAAIMVENNSVNNFTDNIFYGNKNSTGATNLYSELKANNLSNIVNIADNKFQLADAAAYGANNLYSKIAVGNTFATTIADISDVEEGDFTIDCYTGSVGCSKIEESATGTSIASKVGISTFKTQAVNWPAKDFSNNDINNGALVLESSSKPFIVTRVESPSRVLGKDISLKGALAYDTDRKCLMLFDGDKWDCLSKSCDKTIYDVVENIKNHLGNP